MPQFFIQRENIQENKILITNKSDINHIVNVLRHKKKDELLLSGPDNVFYQAEISVIKPEQIETTIKSQYVSDRKLGTRITLAQSVIKSQKQDFLIQKATELGVQEIIPFVSRNTVVKFKTDKDKQQKVQRWQKIVYESSKQCERGDLAEVKPVTTFEEVAKLEGFDLKIFCAEKRADLSIKQLLQQNKNRVAENAKVLLIIGPEGGWDDKEIDVFLDKGVMPVTLGKLVLRAETAVTAAVAQIIYEYEL